MEKKVEFKTPVEFNPIRVQILKRWHSPGIYMLMMQRKKMEQMPVIRLRTEEGRVTSKNGFDVSITTLHLSYLQSRSWPGEGQQQGQAPKWRPHAQIEKGRCKD